MTANVKPEQFTVLDSLRGFAAIAVAVFHFSAHGWGGYLAVDFFLVLSGFILSHSYLYRDKTVGTADFLGHRLARLYPLHVYTLVTYTVVTLLTTNALPAYKDGTLFTFFQQLTLTHNVGLNPGGMTWNYPSWSISVEFWVNVLFIFFVTRQTANATLLFVAVAGLALIYFNTGHLDTHAANYYSFLNSGMVRGIASFLLGVLSYRIYIRCQRIGVMPISVLSASLLEATCVIGVAVILFWRDGNVSRLDFLAPFLFVLVVVVFSLERGVLSQVLKKFSYLGLISYSIYLNQITVLDLARHVAGIVHAPGIVLFGAYLAALLVYSHYTYRYIETPLRRKGRRMFERMLEWVTHDRVKS